MRSTATRWDALDTPVAAFQRGVCDQAVAMELCARGPDAVTLAPLAAARRIAELQAQTAAGGTLSAPSGLRLLCTSANVAPGGGRRRKPPGAKQCHLGHRPAPTRINEHREHRLKVCPRGGGG